MPETHHIGRVTYEAWRAVIIRQRREAGIAEGDAGGDPEEWINVGPGEQDAWQAAGVAARDD